MISKDKIVYYVGYIYILIYTLFKHIVVPTGLGYGTSKFVYSTIKDEKLKNPGYYFSWFFWIFYFIVYYCLRYHILLSIFFYIIFVLLTAAFIVKYIQPTFAPDGNKKKIFLMWFLYFSSVITIYATIYTLHYSYVIFNKEGQRGDRGNKGEDGDKGKSSINTGTSNIAYSQLLKECNDIYRKFKMTQLKYSRKYNKKLDEEKKDEEEYNINNIYFKDNLIRICSSQEFTEKVKNNGLKNTVDYVKPEVAKWTAHILNFENGDKWLDDHFSTEYHWRTSGRYGKLIIKDKKLDQYISQASNHYSSELLDKIKVIYGITVYDKIKKTILIFISNKVLTVYRKRPDDMEKEMDMIKENNDNSILYEIKSIITVKQMMNFYNNHKQEKLDKLLYQDNLNFNNIKNKTRVEDIESKKKLLTQNDNLEKDPFVLIFSHEIWKWGDIKKYTECELQEMIDIEKKEDRQRDDEIFYTKYGK